MSDDMDNLILSDDSDSQSPLTGEATAEAPQFVPPVRKLAVWYNFTRKDGSQGESRIFINWVADIRTSADIMGVEQHLVGSSNGELVAAMVTHWKALES